MPRCTVTFSIFLDDYFKSDGFGDGSDLITVVGVKLSHLAIAALEEAFAQHGVKGVRAEIYEPGSHHNNRRIRFVDDAGNVDYYRLDAKVFDWLLQPLVTKNTMSLIMSSARGKFDKAAKEFGLKFKAEELL